MEHRWEERLPGLDRQDYAEAAERCRAIEAAACELASAVRDGALDVPEALSRIRSRFPDLSEERVSRAWGPAMCFSST